MNIRFAVVAAAAALAVPGLAQGLQVGAGTNITISGLLAVGVKNSQVSNSKRPGLASEWRGDDNTSRLIIASTSKIAEGWNVVFRIESRFQADVRPIAPLVPGSTIYTGNATGWADGDTWGGVSSPYGTLVYGKSTLYYTDTIDLSYFGIAAPGEGYRIWDANGLGTFNLLDQVPVTYKSGLTNSAFTLGNTRSQNVLRFNSVKYGGFDFSVAYSKNPDGDEAKYVAPGTAGYSRNYENGGTLYASARYNRGPLTTSFSYLDKKVQGGVYTTTGLTATAGALDVKAYRLGAAYTLPFKLKVGVVYDSTSIENGYSFNTAEAAKRSVFLVPVSYGFGDHAVYATYGKAGNTASKPDTGASQLNLGYDYALTKRTFVGVYYTYLRNEANGHYTPFLAGTTFGPTTSNPFGTNGENFRQVGINLNYWF